MPGDYRLSQHPGSARATCRAGSRLRMSAMRPSPIRAPTS
jgi:hypothetical protein